MEEPRKSVESWYEEAFDIDLEAARSNWPNHRCGADDFIDGILALITQSNTQLLKRVRDKGSKDYRIYPSKSQKEAARHRDRIWQQVIDKELATLAGSDE